MREVILLVVYLAVMAGVLGGIYCLFFKTKKRMFNHFKPFGKK